MNMGEITIEVKDLIIIYIKKWFWILAAGVACALVFGLLGAYRSHSNALPLEMQLEEKDAQIVKTVENITVADKNNVENLADQYAFYQAYKERTLDYYMKFMVDAGDPSAQDVLVKTDKYYIKTEDVGVKEYLTSLNFSPTVYEQIRTIAPDNGLYDAFTRVSFGTYTEDTLELVNEPVVNREADSTLILTVTIVGDTREQCSDLSDLMNTVVNNQITVLKAKGFQLEIVHEATTITNNVQPTLINRQQSMANGLNQIDTMLANLSNNFILKLDANQKKYFDLLVQRNALEREISAAEWQTETEAETEAEPETEEAAQEQKAGGIRLIKKYLVVGALLGIVLAVCLITFIYLTNDTVKVRGELEELQDIQLLEPVYQAGKKMGAMDRLSCRMSGISPQPEDVSTALLCRDIMNIVDKDQVSSLYLVNISGTEDGQQISAAVASYVEEKSGGKVKAVSGDPFSSPEQLDVFAEAGAAILLVTLRQSKRNDLVRSYRLCEKYGSRLLGVATVEKIGKD